MLANVPSGPEADRYRAFLSHFGFREVVPPIREHTSLATGTVRFFSLAEPGAARYKAAATADGTVGSGLRSGHDWYAFLSSVVDAEAAAGAIAWLETDESPRQHGEEVEPVEALTTEASAADLGVDPSYRALVTPPVLVRETNGALLFEAWFLRPGSRIPVRWTIRARAGQQAEMVRRSAQELVEPRR